MTEPKRGQALAAVLLLALALPGVSSAAVFSSATLKGFDVYRSTVVTREYVRQRYGGAIREYVALRNDRRSAFLQRAERLKKKIVDDLKVYGGLAYADIHYGDYWTTSGRTAYITFDVVDAADAKTRMPFKAAPKGAPADPDNLLAEWDAYSGLGMSLKLSAQIGSDRPACPAFYCTYGSVTPELEAYEQRFLLKAAVEGDRLLAVLNGDARPERRSAAMYLLSYLTDGTEVAGIALDALGDPDPGVRSAALNVLADISVYRKDVPIEPARLFPALDFPSTTDRSKALGVLVGLADNPSYEESLRRRPPPGILGLLKLDQPVINDAAYAFLVLLTGESYDRKDYARWEKWLANPPRRPTTDKR